MTKEEKFKDESCEIECSAREFLKEERNYSEEAKVMAKNMRKKNSLFHHFKVLFSSN